MFTFSISSAYCVDVLVYKSIDPVNSFECIDSDSDCQAFSFPLSLYAPAPNQMLHYYFDIEV